MTIKEQWYDEFMEKLWEHHTCDWPMGNSIPDYPFQLAAAHFDWHDYNGQIPERTVEQAFSDYLKGEEM